MRIAAMLVAAAMVAACGPLAAIIHAGPMLTRPDGAAIDGTQIR